MGLLALLLSLAYHLQLHLAGVVAIDTLTAALNREVRGKLSIGSLQNVSFAKIVAHDVVVRDPEGRVVIELSRLAAWPDWDALFSGIVRVEKVRARDGEVTLFVSGPDEDTVSVAEAFQSSQPSTGPPGNPPLVLVNDIVLDGVRVHGDVPGLEGLEVDDVRLVGGVRAQNGVRFNFYEGHATMTGPYPGRTEIDQIRWLLRLRPRGAGAQRLREGPPRRRPGARSRAAAATRSGGAREPGSEGAGRPAHALDAGRHGHRAFDGGQRDARPRPRAALGADR